MDDKDQTKWERFLNPMVLRENLIVASIYIAAYEVLKNSIIGRIRDFYTTGFDQAGMLVDPKYEKDVLARNRSPVYASLLWLRESGGIEDADIANFDQIRQCRNEIVHEITSLLWQGLKADWATRFTDMVNLLSKIERWWIVNVEIPINSDFGGEEIDEDAIIPGPIMGLRLLIDIALGAEEESRRYFDEFIRRTRGT